ncbi:armadillo-like helical domain containing protein 1 [Amphibalanus amphitrite]|uniref:armadillo-like helical domain containing protein 1 n=1 Tax=Amphibalanus amphitrite TaxID=1232801 RepID=UPI001C919BD0|nr:armadillo-like helical domain containing protein 1 [Amphibalanus amphitrite]
MSAAGDAPAPSQVGGAFGSPLTCADDLWRITKLWDESGSGVRAALLASFLGRFSSEPAVDLETALVGGASLLLARFVAALRLNGSHFSGGGVTGFSTPLSPLLAALRVFLRAQQCHRFAAEALEAGALDALLATLRRAKLRASHADAVLRTLSLLLAAGRRFKEAFVVGDGLRVLCELLGRRQVSTPAVAGRVERLLMQLHEGNPRTVEQLAEFMCQLTESTESQAQLVACRLLAAVLPRVPDHQRAAVAPLLALLRHPDVNLHVEVAEALRVLLNTSARNDVSHRRRQRDSCAAWLRGTRYGFAWRLHWEPDSSRGCGRTLAGSPRN